MKKKKIIKIKKIKICRHDWITSDSCGHCGYYEAQCRKCDIIDLFDSKGKRQKVY